MINNDRKVFFGIEFYPLETSATLDETILRFIVREEGKYIEAIFYELDMWITAFTLHMLFCY